MTVTPVGLTSGVVSLSLMTSSRYNWIYSHNCREQLIGRGLDKYTGDADLEAYLRALTAAHVDEFLLTQYFGAAEVDHDMAESVGCSEDTYFLAWTTTRS